jgi:hypothetical protein
MVSGLFHPSREDANNHPRVFAEYAKSNIWIGVHIGQFAAYMLIYAGGFVALYRFLVKSQFGIVSALAWLGLVLTIITAACLAILQAVDGISLKKAVDSWAVAPAEEKITAFRVAEGIRWTETGINSICRILQGTVAVIFGIAILVKSGVIPRWVGTIGIVAGIVTMIIGLFVAYIGFASSLASLTLASIVIYFAWIIIMGIYMWKRYPNRFNQPYDGISAST